MDDQRALFNQYENDYCNKSTDISRKIDGVSNASGDTRRRMVAEVEYEVKEAEQVIKRMEMEARSLSPTQSKSLLIKIREYKADLQSLKDELRKASKTISKGDAARAELGLGQDYFSTTSGQRERMLTSTERLNRAGDRLQQGRHQLLETEELGVSILEDLSRQRETIIRSRDTLHGADDGISKARRILGTMSRRVLTNKMVMICIAGVVLLAIILIVYYKFIDTTPARRPVG
eukprot:evm.model.scf_955.5 EVM.evm.TU.scf_955.5   scf_955:30381-34125(-)